MIHTIWAKHPIHTKHRISIDGQVYRIRHRVGSRLIPFLHLKVSLHKHGYTQVGLNYQPRKTANLVAEAFLSGTKTDSKCQVLHKNDIKIDSSIENIYYGSYEDNLADAVRNGNRVHHVHKNCDEAKWKPIRVYGKGIDKIFPSIKEAYIFIGVGASAISQALRNNRKTGGYNVELQGQ